MESIRGSILGVDFSVIRKSDQLFSRIRLEAKCTYNAQHKTLERLTGAVWDITCTWLHDQLREVTRELDGRISKKDSVFDIFKEFVEHLPVKLFMDFAAFHIFDPKSGNFLPAELIWTSHPEDQDQESPLGSKRPIDSLTGWLARTVASKTAEAILDVFQDSDIERASTFKKKHYLSGFTIPILSEGKVLGVLECLAKHRLRLSNACLGELTTLGEKIGSQK